MSTEATSDSRVFEGIEEAAQKAQAGQKLLADCSFDEWPKDLPVLAVRAPTMPGEMLPDKLRPWIEDVCERMRVPLEMVAIPAMVTVAALVGRRLAIRPKQHDDWTVIPNLWGCVTAPPGMLKTPAMAEALRPFRRVEAHAREKWLKDDQERAAQRASLEIQVTALDSQARKMKSVADTRPLAAQLIEKRKTAQRV